ncbi:RlpA-like double-psi beta-barrel domain-containing protein [Streptomyces sp. NBC_00272]|uniref:RlpA-like double-psi beta-barrel domain-containing protein n=1 Tax=Streptomyces sp. NBC_00272 TaxID=2975698 RepID=UPI002E29C770|nr:RlpA-like double-psi beta-barrel domain-containing protein [Streptomyces sp. NBC_00272]
MAALLATGPAAVITAATASASEDTGTTISAASASEQQGEPASTETELSLSVRAPEPGKTTAPPPEPGKTTAAPPEPGKTTAAPPKPKPGKTTAAPPKPGKTTPAPPKPKPGKTTAAPPKPGKTTPAPPKPKPGKSYEGTADFFSSNGVAGACGRAIKDSDFVAALDPTMFGTGNPAPHCGKKVIVTYKGKSIVATVLDASPTAQKHGLDLTPAAFKALAPLDQGTINITWRFAE